MFPVLTSPMPFPPQLLLQIVVPDKWKDGARNVVGGKDGGRKAGKIGSKKKFKTRYLNTNNSEHNLNLNSPLLCS